jgi:hypothetical protein
MRYGGCWRSCGESAISSLGAERFCSEERLSVELQMAHAGTAATASTIFLAIVVPSVDHPWYVRAMTETFSPGYATHSRHAAAARAGAIRAHHSQPPSIPVTIRADRGRHV